jgi:3D (Asp-Asp-Asp) domain-containing protein
VDTNGSVLRGRAIHLQEVTLALLLAVLPAATALAGPREKLGTALVTFYWLIDESASRYRGNPTSLLEDSRGRVIARTTRRFKRDLVVEGSGRLRDGRTVSYDRKLAGRNRFRISASNYGDGSLGCPLTPYHTVAVDPHFVELGSTIYIPQLKGTPLPDGTIHDGIFVADDRGHFHGRHVDIFIGLGPRAARPFSRRGYGSRSHVTVYLVGDSTPDDCRRSRQPKR